MKIIEKSTILLPDIATDLYSYAVVACDQFTSNPEYWDEVERLAENRPSTAHIILPEIYLNSEQEKQRLRNLSELTRRYSERLLNRKIDGAIAVERTLADGSIRRGIVVAVDLECYEFNGNSAAILPTENTIVSRIPARCEARRLSTLECPHILMLLDNPENSVIEPLFNLDLKLLYTTNLQQGGGSIKGYAVTDESAFSKLQKQITKLYVGDGNHSLAAAKTLYEEIKADLGEKATNHPARYCLVEIINLYSEALPVLPIHRVLFSASIEEVKEAANSVLGSGNGELNIITPEDDVILNYDETKYPLAVLAADAICETIVESKTDAHIDYIHGDDELRSLSADNAIGFLMPTPNKSELIPYIEQKGVFPKKYFSLGHGADKRYYLECRKIVTDKEV